MAWITKIKHPFCSISHWLGALLGLIGSGFLLSRAWGDPKAMVAVAIYGISLVGLYTASGLYHTLRCEGKREVVLRKFDHMGIFLLILGTYVPVCLLALSPGFGWTFLIFQAVFALTGILGTFFLRKFPEVLNVVLYLLMGWMCVPALGYITAHWSSTAIALLVSGGVIYTIGAVIYAMDRPHLWPGKFSAHDLWHVFVLGGSACHFALVALILR